MPYFAGLLLSEIRDLSESLEIRLSHGTCDALACGDALRLARAVDELLDAYERSQRALRVARGLLAEARSPGKYAKKPGKSGVLKKS
jgi:hypothetical protein